MHPFKNKSLHIQIFEMLKYLIDKSYYSRHSDDVSSFVGSDEKVAQYHLVGF